MKRNGRVLLISMLVIFFLAFIVRLTPLIWSPYPYNIDGLAEARMAGDIFERGDLSIPEDAGYWGSYVVDMPSLDALIAMSAHVLGIEPLLLSQILIAVMGALSCVLVVLVVHHVTGSNRASLLAGIFLALFGTYVFCTASVWKEALGLTMMVLIAGLFLLRRDLRMRIMMTIALLMMIFVHHHSAVITYLFFSFAIAGDAYLSRRNSEWSWRNYADIGTMVTLWAVAGMYYREVELPYYEFLSPQQDLYLLMAIAGAMLMLMLLTLSREGAGARHPYLKITAPVVGVSLLFINYMTPIFPGVPGTEQAVFVFASAYLILLVPVWVSAENLLRTREHWRPMILALIFAPLTMILFSFLRGLDLTSYTIAYRTFDFLDLAFAALFGMGIALMIHQRLSLRRTAPAIFLLVLLFTTPLAFQTESLFDVHNHTYEYEVDALQEIHDLSANRTLNSDQRLGTSAKSLFNFSGGNDLAIRIETGGGLDEYQWYLVKNGWTSVGAQQFPFGQTVLDNQVLADFLEEHNVFIVAGPSDNQLIVAANLP